MAGTDKTTNARVMRRMVGLMIAGALAAAPATAAGIGGEGVHLFNGPVVSTFTSNLTGMMATPGCAPEPAGIIGCESRIRLTSGASADHVCAATTVGIDGSYRTGACALTDAAGRVASAQARVTTTRDCRNVYVFNLRDSNAVLVDALGHRWTVTEMLLRAGEYRHAGAADSWTLEPVSGVTTIGSYLKARNGNRTLIAYLNGTIAAAGNCAADFASTQYVLAFSAIGWIFPDA